MNHYYSRDQDSAIKLFEFEVNILGRSFTIQNAAGVFSSKKLDRGSEVLIKYAIVENGSRILDLGCGCGVIGIALSKAYDVGLTMSDVNRRALKLARMNARNLEVEADIIESDGFDNIAGSFSTILLNPPQSAGKNICIKLIKESWEHLLESGSLQMVARHNKGGRALSCVMEETFGNVEVLARKSGYRVYKSIRKQ